MMGGQVACINIISVKKGKAVPLHAEVALGVTGGTAPALS
jgi:hypothetical protein